MQKSTKLTKANNLNATQHHKFIHGNSGSTFIFSWLAKATDFTKMHETDISYLPPLV